MVNRDRPYEILSGITKANLIVLVNEYLIKGYIPVGGVAFTLPDVVTDQWDKGHYTQAMILKPYLVFMAQ